MQPQDLPTLLDDWVPGSFTDSLSEATDCAPWLLTCHGRASLWVIEW
jgi:hypothetical protein